MQKARVVQKYLAIEVSSRCVWCLEMYWCLGVAGVHMYSYLKVSPGIQRYAEAPRGGPQDSRNIDFLP